MKSKLVTSKRGQEHAERRTVTAAARERLARCGRHGLTAIRCEHHEGVLFLRGRVPSYYLKQMAQEAVRTVAGVEEIVNCIEVSAVARSGAP